MTNSTRSGLAWLAPVAVVLLSLVAGLAVWQLTAHGLSEAELAGQSSFRTFGCAGCHGRNGEGDEGPAMPGHSAEQVIRQVRAPLGAMPLFSHAELPDSALRQIIDYVEGMRADSQGHDAHGQVTSGDLSDRDALAGYQWLTLMAVEVEDSGEARHHLGHLAELVEGDHKAALAEIEDLVAAGNFRHAGEAMREMLAGFEPERGSTDRVRLRLAMRALAEEDDAEATEHLMRIGGRDLKGVARQAAEALGSDKAHAMRMLSAALADDDEAPHDDAEAHHEDDEMPHDDGEMPHDGDGEVPHDDGEAPEDGDGEMHHGDGDAPEDD